MEGIALALQFDMEGDLQWSLYPHMAMELELELLNFDLNLGEVMALDLQLEHLEGMLGVNSINWNRICVYSKVVDQWVK
ncbi:hypothetical protein BSU19_24120, partial [Salmonella enterica subsp. enterica serovar Enteritidis]